MDDVSNRQVAETPPPVGGRLVPLSRTVPNLAANNGRYGEYPAGAGDESKIGTLLVEYWRIFKKRKWIILSIVSAFVAIGTLNTLMKTPLYSSTVSYRSTAP